MKKYIFILITVVCLVVCDQILVQEHEDVVQVVCEMVKSIDFTINQSLIDYEDDDVYKDAYFDILRNKMPITDLDGEAKYFKDLYKIGEALFEYEYYYYDLDGDSLPELGIKSIGYTYIIKYDHISKESQVLFGDSSIYFRILGTGQIWYHNGIHVGYISDRYIVLNSDNNWEDVISFERSNVSAKEIERGFDEYYCVTIGDYEQVDIGKENWHEVTMDFFNMTENPITPMTFKDVFGERI